MHKYYLALISTIFQKITLKLKDLVKLILYILFFNTNKNNKAIFLFKDLSSLPNEDKNKIYLIIKISSR